VAGEARGIGKAREANQLAAARVRIVPAPVEAVPTADVVVMIVAVRVVAAIVMIVADHAPGEVSTTMRRPRRQVQSRGVGWPAKEQLDCGTTRGMTAMNATQATT